MSSSSETQARQAELFQKLVVYIGEPYYFLVCQTCGVALPLSRIEKHFSRGQHSYRKSDCARLLQAWETLYLSTCPIKLRDEADLINWARPSTPSAPILHLPVSYAFQCRFMNTITGRQCTALYSGLSEIQKHCRDGHGWQNSVKRGRASALALRQQQQRSVPWEANVPCQRLTPVGQGSSYWRVSLPGDSQQPATKPQPEAPRNWDQLEAQLDQRAESKVTNGSTRRYPLHHSLWLEKTGWTQFLKGQDLSTVALLLAPPTPDEPGLAALLQSFDALIETARGSVLSEKVNVFALHRVNSFIRGRHFKKPLHTKLLDGTYCQYIAVWHKLLCFVYRLAVLHRGPNLYYTLTPAQLEALSQIPVCSAPSYPARTERPTEAQQQACLSLCIALLDHRLHGKLTDSILVGFLAALGINQSCDGFDDAVIYTPKLSALVKLAQLLVVQYAVSEHKAGRTQYPNELVGELQDRFIVFGSESPMNWILNLRAYGAKARDNTTALGFISWTDNGESLSYKSLEFSMNGLRWFLRDQIQEAQDQLHDLLLLPEADLDTRAKQVPQLCLTSLKDDPTICSANYSFLQDERNQEILDGQQRYLLNQLRHNPRLRRRFFSNPETLTWDKKRVKQYLQLTEAFLRRLLLLVHITGGQPARGTELLTLRWRNSSHSEVRNIFIENGLVSFVTSYHKNYSASNTTKIIHRYLPPEVGDLLVYYVWLVVPFLEQLHILTPIPGLGDPGSFLWPASINGAAKLKKTALGTGSEDDLSVIDPCGEATQEEPWESSYLGRVIKSELARGLRTTACIMSWRHAAIAISRRHLPEGSKFKRDYGPDERSTAMDLQAAHTSRMAGICYGRDMREGPGQTASLRAEFRTLSRNWHICLGFGIHLPPRDEPDPPSRAGLRALQECSGNLVAGQKRTREEEKNELNSWLLEKDLLRCNNKRISSAKRSKILRA